MYDYDMALRGAQITTTNLPKFIRQFFHGGSGSVRLAHFKEKEYPNMKISLGSVGMALRLRENSLKEGKSS